jgi:hypothetical protein
MKQIRALWIVGLLVFWSSFVWAAEWRVGIARTEITPTESLIAPNPHGSVDHVVPVLRVRDENDRLLAVLFGYACHNTTLGGGCCQYNGEQEASQAISLGPSGG